MTYEEFKYLRSRLEALKDIAWEAIKDLSNEYDKVHYRHGWRVHLNDLMVESAQLYQAILDEDEEARKQEDLQDDHHNDELNGN